MDQHIVTCDMDDDCTCQSNITKGFIWSAPDLFGKKTIIGFTDGEVEVSLIPKTQANKIISSGHYSKTVVWSSNLHLGIYWNGRLIGAMQYGPPMNPASACKIIKNTSSKGCLELNRLWMDDQKPSNCASRAISFSVKIIKATRPEVRWIQSFADERCGKLGAVYQACSFVYLGSHKTTFYHLDGEWFHQSMMGRAQYDKRGWWSGPKIARLNANKDKARPFEFNQYRYIKAIKKSAIKDLLVPTYKYPKITGE